MPFDPVPIQIKGGLEANIVVNTDMKVRELAVSTDTDKLFVGKGEGNTPDRVYAKATADNTDFTPEEDTFPNGTTNVDQALKHLFTYANSGKNDIADSIGYAVPYSDTFASLASNIDEAKADLITFLPKAEQTLVGNEKLHDLANKLENVRVFKQKVGLRKLSGKVDIIDITPINGAYPDLDKLLLVPLIRVDDGGTSRLIADFNNGDADDFSPYPNPYVVFDGTAKLKNSYTYDLNPTPTTNVTEAVIDISEFDDYKDLTFGFIIGGKNTQLALTALPKPQVIVASGDIPIDDVIDINQFILSQSGTAVAVYAVSFDSGNRWFVDTSSGLNVSCEQIDITNTTIFNQKGNWRPLDLVAIQNIRYFDNGQNPNTIRFAYLLSDFSYTSKSIINSMSLDVILSGTFVPTTESRTTNAVYTSYDKVTGQVSVTYNQTDAYIINYLDKA
jgi:hypothetical protein